MKKNWVKFAAAGVIVFLLLQKRAAGPMTMTQYIPSGPVSPPVPIGFGF